MAMRILYCAINSSPSMHQNPPPPNPLIQLQANDISPRRTVQLVLQLVLAFRQTAIVQHLQKAALHIV